MQLLRQAPRLILVHSPLTGPQAWRPAADLLAGDGWDVATPDLTGTVAGGPPYVVRQAEVIARAAAGRPVVLAGHSGAGPLLAVAGAHTGRVRKYVFVDAGLPTPGRNWLQTAPPELAAQLRGMADTQGGLPPWPQWWGEEVMAELVPDPDMRRQFVAGCPRLPLAMFAEVHPPAPGWPDAPGAYLQLSPAYREEADRARDLGWPVAELPGHHLTLLTDPAAVVQALRAEMASLERPDAADG
jgi:hypothetical protein